MLMLDIENPDSLLPQAYNSINKKLPLIFKFGVTIHKNQLIGAPSNHF
jgi:hypothetical protein